MPAPEMHLEDLVEVASVKHRKTNIACCSCKWNLRKSIPEKSVLKSVEVKALVKGPY